MSIISISGKMGSGKDTIGEIIQNLCLSEHGETFEIKKWAYKVKQVASIVSGIPIEKFEDQEFKKSFLGPEWSQVKCIPLNAIPVFEDVHFSVQMSVRDLLQKVGTDAMRDGLHENVWINAMMSEYKKNSNWIITDTRFPNELSNVKNHKGITINVTRTIFINEDTHPIGVNLHQSETALDNAKFDYTIKNDGDIEQLIKAVKLILKTENII
jgi:hypothetical protein